MMSEIRTPETEPGAAAGAALKHRLDDIDIMKGMAIFLVVLGHVVSNGHYPEGNPWYWDLQYWIYNFHMPLFMYLSGLTFFLFQKPIADPLEYCRFLARRGARLLPALFLVGAVVVVSKAMFSDVLYVDKPVHGVWSDLLKLLYDPWGGALRSMWFVYALFMLYAIVGPFLLVTRWNPYPLVVAGAVIHFVPLTDYFCLSRVGEYGFMFALGCVAALHFKAISAVSSRFFPAFLVIFLLISGSIYLEWDGDWKKIVLSLASVPVAHAVARMLRGRAARVFAILGFGTFIIYLMNTLFIGITKALMLKLHGWDGSAFLVFLPVLLAAGTVGPLLLKLKIFKRYPLLDRMTG